MSRNSLEQLMEDFFIQLFRCHRSLKGKEFRHADSDNEAKLKVITVEAKQGEDLLEGPRGPNGECRSKVEVTVRYRASGAAEKENDAVGDALQRTIRRASDYVTPAQKTPGFHLLILTEQIAGDRGHTDNTRTKQLVIPCEAGLIQ